MSKDDGGLVHPTYEKLREREVIEGGLTMRDLFAAQALTGFIIAVHSDLERYEAELVLAQKEDISVEEHLAWRSYSAAQRMLEVKAKLEHIEQGAQDE